MAEIYFQGEPSCKQCLALGMRQESSPIEGQRWSTIEGAYIEPLRCYLLVEHVDNLLKRIFFSCEPPARSSQLAENIAAQLLKGIPCEADLDLSLLSPFQKEVYSAISALPHGKTMTYGDVAKKIGRPKACRAVGRALGANPFPVLIPCHRVLSKKGLGGYRWGIELKKRLLAIEAADP